MNVQQKHGFLSGFMHNNQCLRINTKQDEQTHGVIIIIIIIIIIIKAAENINIDTFERKKAGLQLNLECVKKKELFCFIATWP